MIIGLNSLLRENDDEFLKNTNLDPITISIDKDNNITFTINNDGNKEEIPIEGASEIYNMEKITEALIKKPYIPEDYKDFVLKVISVLEKYNLDIKSTNFFTLNNKKIDGVKNKLNSDSLKKNYHLKIKITPSVNINQIQNTLINALKLSLIKRDISTNSGLPTVFYGKLSDVDKRYVFIFNVDKNIYNKYFMLNLICFKRDAIFDKGCKIRSDCNLKLESASFNSILKEEFSFLEEADKDVDTEIKIDDDTNEDNEPVTFNIDNDQKVVINVGGENIPLEEVSMSRNIKKIREALIKKTI